MQRSTLLLTATLATAMLYSRWCDGPGSPHAHGNNSWSPRIARGTSFHSMLIRYRTQVEANIDTLRQRMAHQTQRNQDLHDELDTAFNNNEQRRLLGSQQARATRQSVFGQTITERQRSSSAADLRREKEFQVDMQVWTQDMQLESKVQEQALKAERKLWKKWNARFREAQKCANQALIGLRKKYLAAHKDRAKRLESALACTDTPNNGFPHCIIIDDVTMYRPIRYDLGGEAFQASVEDEDSEDDVVEDKEMDNMEAEAEDVCSEHEDVQANSRLEAEDKDIKIPDAQIQRVSNRRYEKLSQIEGESLESMEHLNEDEEVREKAFIVNVDGENQRWMDAIDTLKEEILRRNRRFDDLFEKHQNKYDVNRSLERSFNEIDDEHRLGCRKMWKNEFSRKQKHYLGVFDVFLAEESRSWSEQLQKQEHEFQRVLVDRVERMFEYWRDMFITVRMQQNMHSESFFQLYQRLLHGDLIEHATYDWEVERRLTDSEKPTWAALGVEVSEHPNSLTIVSRDLEPSEVSFSHSFESPEITDSLLNFTESNPFVPKGNDSPYLRMADYFPGQREKHDLEGVQTSSDHGDDNTVYDSVSPFSMQTLSFSPREAVFKFLHNVWRFTAASFPLMTVSKVINILKWTPNLVKYTKWEEIQAEWKFRGRQAERRLILDYNSLRQTGELRSILSESFQKAQAQITERRKCAQNSEAERDEEFRRIEVQRQQEFEGEMNRYNDEDNLEMERQQLTFKKGHSKRWRRVRKCLTEMRQELKNSCDSREITYSSLSSKLTRLVDEQLTLFEAEEEERAAQVDDMIASTISR
ncbi:hypothetical protein E4T56_gene3070 [Termitomyces sp. T112]|nr:hypothetical protein E4T56_gene3070 [Termitomyces sp. T112]